ncbi:hypothetical protein MCOR02_007203 [Pyricularia oryzae]|uniref:Small acidic protein n=2 Tax=Pyricularia oryzae TaxID=318829 RepID=A0AA97NZD9_PYRO3|nr:hypothetical protein OOU_Y34scaffold00514g52 [Pyricularia oryzae Y34]KAH9432510.1 hypothetical protein MCOR02_007203 [Pyricularia oryzae]KAI6357392.1 hypothetical protein MCOR31_010352 [Pyricularia oryzae]KAI6384074.1 hypothetical protein MCOR24_011742 [Pyricularia oryzae]KAI6453997.1 hypothetical protein MCOR17_009089 [Pyricularia oryzae]
MSSDDEPAEALKAASLNSKEAQRLLRAAMRKEKKDLKAEVKKERKLKAKQASKSESAEKETKSSKGKKERQMIRLKLRAEQLKAEGLKLLEDAEKARVEYEEMAAQAQVRLNYYTVITCSFRWLFKLTILLPRSEKTKDGKQTSEVETSSSSGSSDSESDAKSTSDADSSPAPEPVPQKKSKKSKKSEKSEAVDEDSLHGKKKKAKKNKEKSKETDALDAAPAAEEEPLQDTKEAKKARQEVKKRKRSAESDVAVTTADDTAKEKKSKKSKSKDETIADASAIVEKKPARTGAAEQWNVSGLDGGASRQDKFMRLLGGKKAGNESASVSTGTSKGKVDSYRSADDLQRQFDYGMKMKHEMGGQKRGLGA